MTNLSNYFPSRKINFPPSALVASIETITVAITANAAATIGNLSKGQDYTQCVPFATWKATSYAETSSNSNNAQPIPVMIDNAGTPAVSVNRGGGSTLPLDNITVDITVVEFNSDILVQSGEWHNTGFASALDIALPTTVVQGNAFVLAYDRIDGNGAWNVRHTARKVLAVDGTKLTIYTNAPTSPVANGVWYVVEDTTGGDHFSVQHVSQAYTTETTIDAAISAVDIGKTLILSSNQQASYSNDGFYWKYWLELTSTTNLRAIRFSGAGSGIFNHNIIEFADTTTVQHFNEEIAAGVTAARDTTITAVNINKATVIDGTCQRDHYTGDDAEHVDFQNQNKLVLTSSTNVQATRYANPYTVKRHYHGHVVEWEMD